ncbi:transposase [Wolbachia endosymbiont (group A) of Therophilus tumidulus]|uniref:transposase n=1 Tax=Wolbachia endosymbiont (group A) of Therophilus tumidulus TaxID=3066214 RepID=UPI00376EACC4
MSSRESANKELLEAIQKIYQVSKCRYGAPKIHAELKALGKSCNLKTVQSIVLPKVNDKGIISYLSYNGV